ncbi:hypothetical protein [uncultured Gordonia sp.]|uniref:hypothetical protein n=1 Tax=Gordonia sp. (in: high G+C Gram-positive bacteria) TaxID=84139 RepID=UPI0026254071|nr:hypothetical protein [uncultured Gordonia sp.]
MKFTHYAEPLELETLTGSALLAEFGTLDVRDDVIAIEHEGAPEFLTVAQAEHLVTMLTECIKAAS